MPAKKGGAGRISGGRNFEAGSPAPRTARREASPAEPESAGGSGLAAFYELHQEWPGGVGRAEAEHLLSALGPPPRRCLFLGSATGVNDVLPFARRQAASRLLGDTGRRAGREQDAAKAER